jgi:hypothetical protein
MKNPVKGLLLAIMLILAALPLSACGDKPIASISFIEGSVSTYVEQGSTPDLSGLKVLVTFVNGATKTVSSSELNIGRLDTTAVGPQVLTVTYLVFSTQIIFYITEQDVSGLTVFGYSSPEFIAAYNANKQNGNVFLGAPEAYAVGNQNPFRMFPEVTLMDITDPIPLETKKTAAVFRSIIKVEEKIGIVYEELTGADLNAVVEINAELGLFDFADTVSGRTFKITMSPDPSYMAIDLSTRGVSFSHEFVVLDGWNATGLQELSLLNNASFQNDATHWDERWNSYWAANTYTDVHGDKIYLSTVNLSTIKGMFLHNDLTVTNGDLPAALFVGGDRANLLQKYASPFVHITPENSDFVFNGNYFNIDASGIKMAAIEAAGTEYKNQGTAFLFDFTGDRGDLSDSGYREAFIHKGNATIKNFSAMGNVSVSFVADVIANAGGLSFLRMGGGKNMTAHNIATTGFFVTVNVGEWNNWQHENAKNFLSYLNVKNTLVQPIGVWSANLDISNSKFVNNGGPTIILTDAYSSQADTQRFDHDGDGRTIEPHVPDITYPIVTVDDYTKAYLNTPLNAQAPWFGLSPGSALLATMLDALSEQIALATDYRLTDANGNLGVNGVIMPSALNDAYILQGDLTFADGYKLDVDDNYLTAYKLTPYGAGGAPFIVGKNGAILIFDATGNILAAGYLSNLGGLGALTGAIATDLFDGGYAKVYINPSATYLCALLSVYS